MSDSMINTQSMAQSHLDKAETYIKLGLDNQVRYELEQAKKLDPYVTQEPRYKAFLEEAESKAQTIEGLKIPLRIGAGMVLISALVDVSVLIIVFSSGGGSDLGSGDVISPIIDIVIAVNLWQINVNWQRYTVWWATLGLVLFGGAFLVSGDFISLLIQIGYSGSLILLLAGTPTKVRTYASIGLFLVMYLGLVCLIFGLSFLGLL